MTKDEDEEEFRKKLNSDLPEDVRVFCALRCSSRFNAKNCTSNRDYSYYLPSFMLTKMSELYFGSKTAKDQVPAEADQIKNPNEEEQKKPQGIKIIKTETEEPIGE